MESDSVAEALQRYRDAERAYVDATFPVFRGHAKVSHKRRAHVQTLHSSLDRARAAYFDSLKDGGWTVPFREWSERPPQEV